MDMQQINLRDIRVGDWLMIPPGNGKHRGKQNDSGIFVVSDIWTADSGTVYLDGEDMADRWQYFFEFYGDWAPSGVRSKRISTPRTVGVVR